MSQKQRKFAVVTDSAGFIKKCAAGVNLCKILDRKQFSFLLYPSQALLMSYTSSYVFFGIVNRVLGIGFGMVLLLEACIPGDARLHSSPRRYLGSTTRASQCQQQTDK